MDPLCTHATTPAGQTNTSLERNEAHIVDNCISRMILRYQFGRDIKLAEGAFCNQVVQINITQYLGHTSFASYQALPTNNPITLPQYLSWVLERLNDNETNHILSFLPENSVEQSIQVIIEVFTKLNIDIIHINFEDIVNAIKAKTPSRRDVQSCIEAITNVIPSYARQFDLPDLEEKMYIKQFHEWVNQKGFPRGFITRLYFSHDHNIQKLPNLSLFVNLNFLQMLDSSCLMDLSSLVPLERLKHINFHDCKNFINLSLLRGLTKLSKIVLYSCTALLDLSGIESCFDLEVLCLCHCESLTNLSALKRCTRVAKLKISECHKLNDLSVLENLTILSTLSLSSCAAFDLSPIQHLLLLTDIRLSFCPNVTKLVFLTHLTQLRKFTIHCCHSLLKLNGIEKAIALEKFHAYNCENLEGIKPITACSSLNQLSFLSCGKLPAHLREQSDSKKSTRKFIERITDHFSLFAQASPKNEPD